MPSTELPDSSLVAIAYRGLWLNLIGVERRSPHPNYTPDTRIPYPHLLYSTLFHSIFKFLDTPVLLKFSSKIQSNIGLKIDFEPGFPGGNL